MATQSLKRHFAATHMVATPGQAALTFPSAFNRNEGQYTLLRPVKLNMPTWLSTKDQSLSPFSFVRCPFRSLRTCCSASTGLSEAVRDKLRRGSVCLCWDSADNRISLR